LEIELPLGESLNETQWEYYSIFGEIKFQKGDIASRLFGEVVGIGSTMGIISALGPSLNLYLPLNA